MLTNDDILKNEVRALSLKQPFADLMLRGKEFETRSWKTNYTGLVLICASRSYYNQATILSICGEKQTARIEAIYNKLGREPWQLTGQAIAVGRLVNCKQASEYEKEPFNALDPIRIIEEKSFVKFRPDIYLHHYRDITPIEPIPWKGQQGWRRLTDNEKNLIKISQTKTVVL